MIKNTRFLKHGIRGALCLLAAGGWLPAMAQTVVVPLNGTPPTLTPVMINNGPGDQYDPHVSGDWAAYSSDLAIRYFRFSTSVDAEIPMGASSRDLLSDISGSKIVFSRIITGVKTAVMVFDAATAAAPIEIDPGLATTRIGSAIGGNTVAYIDFGLEANGEIVIHDLATSTSMRMTTDTSPDQSPSVSPDSNVVTWEHCGSSFSNCDIWQAVRAGAVWTVGVVSDNASAEANPDSNGSLVVYDSFRSSNGDVFWRPVIGGAEVRLQMAGIEANPSIAGNFIAFESRPTLAGTSDIFVYDITANRLYQITNTPTVTEQLNDITLLGDGSVRVVWTTDEDGSSSRNVRGATFSLPGVVDNTCNGQPVTQGCTVNGVAQQACLGTAGNDTIFGTQGRDVIQGLAGADVIRGLGGDDIICGGDGNDTLKGNRGQDRLFGEKGNDLLNGHRDKDALDGGEDADTCRVGRGIDTFVNCETVIRRAQDDENDDD